MAINTRIKANQLRKNEIKDDHIAPDANIEVTKLDKIVILADGSQPFIADQSLNGFHLTNVGAPINSTDVANQEYVDQQVTTGTGSLSLNDLSDVNLTAPTDKEVVQYNDASSEWVNDQSPAIVEREVKLYTLTSTDIANRHIMLDHIPLDPDDVELTVIGGIDQNNGLDFKVAINTGVDTDVWIRNPFPLDAQLVTNPNTNDAIYWDGTQWVQGPIGTTDLVYYSPTTNMYAVLCASAGVVTVSVLANKVRASDIENYLALCQSNDAPTCDITSCPIGEYASLYWVGLGLDGILEVGDQLQVSYEYKA